ncbi:hypothetical protein TRFO_41521 [Tritrichomonas foetus]|uniref:Uncharacterized protein n=1 Tax=Tritrichomonas foetus TaxID=1144522 RepID=A0A1J4L0C3_9EUKA|nr:hypothetical protein TRFO_41521 [Tritrichomonas foetus]|eukprot:OHT16858.1 hypothetical protein TRFO_41521 [Tritrichomonas foetus]
MRAGAQTNNPKIIQTAVLHSDVEIVKLLMEYGANPNEKDQNGKNAFDFLLLPNQKDIEDVLKNTKALPPINHDKPLTDQISPPITSLQDLFERLPAAPVRRQDPPVSIQIM